MKFRLRATPTRRWGMYVQRPPFAVGLTGPWQFLGEVGDKTDIVTFMAYSAVLLGQPRLVL